MPRLSFTVFSILSLMICVTTCFAWVAGDPLPHFLTIERYRSYSLICGRGTIVLEVDTYFDESFFMKESTVVYVPRSARWHIGIDKGYPGFLMLLPNGKVFANERIYLWSNALGASGAEARYFAVRCRTLVILTAVTPLLAAVKWYRRVRRIRPGHCIQCGYDLRATSGRCPECGTIPATPCSIE